jgi:uncharacterized membrane protein YidH (DUF202 family)
MDERESHSQADYSALTTADDPRVPLAHERTDLAYERSRWAAERTLMAWIRTSLSMISFGFAIDKIFGCLQRELDSARLDGGYHLLGVLLVLVGILFLILSSAEHLIILRRLAARLGTRGVSFTPKWSLPLFAAAVMLAIGAAALILIVE